MRNPVPLCLTCYVLALMPAQYRASATQVPFSEPQAVVSVSGARFALAVDLDSDGRLDALSASTGGGSKIAWYRNLGADDGTGPCGAATSACFGPQEVISTAADGPMFLQAADLDGDGDVDTLSASSTDDKVAWYENLGPDDGTGPCGAITSACFGPQRVISTAAEQARVVSVADVDGDGDVDALSASFEDDKIAWYENLGPDDGTGSCGTVVSACFGPQQVISTAGDGPNFVQAADVDGDGDVDALSASLNDDEVAWFENLGPDDGTGPCSAVTSACFGPQQVISTAGDGAASVHAADVDGDGDMDALSSSVSDDEVAWFENLGPDDGSGPCGVATAACFGPQQVVTAAADGAQVATAADIDGDGDVDALSASTLDDKIAWYENLGPDDGTGPCGAVTSACFGPQQVITTALVSPKSLLAADVDGDGDADLLSATVGGPTITWHENLTIHRSAHFPTGINVHSAADGVDQLFAGDFDNDGGVDLLSAQLSANRITLYRNNDDGTFWTLKHVFTAATGIRSVFGADLDRDGDLDALSASFSDDSIRWYENTGFGSVWTATTISTAANGANGVHAADLDGDGDPDALSASTNDDRIAWYENRLNEASADFGPQTTISTAADGARAVFAADLDGDGDPDVLSASQSDHKIAWYENTGGGAFHPQQLVIDDGAMSAQSVVAADVDGDGDQDVIAASAGDDTVAWYANDGAGVFSAAQVVSAGLDANEVSAADLDRDGDIDILSASISDNTVAWHENAAGDGSTWTTHVVTSSALSARHAIAADIDGDGALDIASASFTDDTIAWFRNQGGQFSTAATDTAQKVVANGQLEDALAVEVRHDGRQGDTDVELTALEIQLTDGVGVALASAQANVLFQALRVYADDGSGSFEETFDTLVSTVAAFSLDAAGLQTVAMTDDDPSVRVPFGAPKTFFVTLEMTADAESQNPSAFQVNHLSDADEADDADHDIPLWFRPGEAVGTGVIDTELTSATCQAPFDLDLENRTIATTVVCQAGTILRGGPALIVSPSGDLALEAGQSIDLGNGVSAEAGSTLRLELDPSLLP